jgi:hypothetical protein
MPPRAVAIRDDDWGPTATTTKTARSNSRVSSDNESTTAPRRYTPISRPDEIYRSNLDQ